jgi:2-methylcitrate dehydratase PrpD
MAAALPPDPTRPAVTAGLAAFVAGWPAARIPQEARDKAARCLFDTVACMLAGAASEEAHPLTDFAASRGKGDAIVFGTALRVDPATAALINGTFGHALDYDDVLSIMPAHPSTVILPALFAMAPPGTSGARLVDAYIIGVEVGARLGIAITNGHYRRGWHATGTLAIFSAVGGLGRLLSLDAELIARAFGIAASMSSGLQCNFGTMVKPLHAGWAAHNAVTAVALARSGLTASETAFEAPGGFFSTYGVEQSDLARIMDGIGEPFAMISPGLALKKYPCCYALHRPIDALIELRRRHAISPDSVAQLVCRVAPGALRPLIHDRPTTGLEAKFSMDYTLAAGMLDGQFDLEAYGDRGPNRPGIADLYPRISKIEDPRCYGDEGPASGRSAGTVGFVEVEIRLRDGTTDCVRIDRPTGSPGKDLTWDDLMAKFADCGREAGLDADAIDAARTRFATLSDAPDIHAALKTLARSDK